MVVAERTEETDKATDYCCLAGGVSEDRHTFEGLVLWWSVELLSEGSFISERGRETPRAARESPGRRGTRLNESPPESNTTRMARASAERVTRVTGIVNKSRRMSPTSPQPLSHGFPDETGIGRSQYLSHPSTPSVGRRGGEERLAATWALTSTFGDGEHKALRHRHNLLDIPRLG